MMNVKTQIINVKTPSTMPSIPQSVCMMNVKTQIIVERDEKN